MRCKVIKKKVIWNFKVRSERNGTACFEFARSTSKDIFHTRKLRTEETALLVHSVLKKHLMLLYF
jgi:hypothetical protein